MTRVGLIGHGRRMDRQGVAEGTKKSRGGRDLPAQTFDGRTLEAELPLARMGSRSEATVVQLRNPSLALICLRRGEYHDW